MWPMDEQQWLTLNAEVAGNSPGAWAFKSERLKGAADQLEFRPFWTVRYMLLGLAIENALKGLVVARGGAVVVEGSNVRMPWPGSRGHALVQLAQLAGVAFGADDAELLDKLTTFVLWGAKYPVPLRVGPLTLDGSTWELDAAERIHERLMRELVPLVREADQAREAERRRVAEVLAGPVREWEDDQATPVERGDGAVLMQDNAASYPHVLATGDDVNAVVCVSSGTDLELDPATPAARCRAGHLHFLVSRWEPLRGATMNTVEMVET